LIQHLCGLLEECTSRDEYGSIYHISLKTLSTTFYLTKHHSRQSLLNLFYNTDFLQSLSEHEFKSCIMKVKTKMTTVSSCEE